MTGAGVRTIRLVRHGRAAAGWDTDPDPDLDGVGHRQAVAAADRLLALGDAAPAIVVSSPLRRCRSTAAVFADRIGEPVTIAPEVAEIPSPEGVPMGERVEWLRGAMRGRWADLDRRYAAYRDTVVEYVAGCADGTLVVSHFVAINTVIGTCLGDDRLVIRSLDNCSITTVAIDATGRLALIEGGHEADTMIR